MLLKNKAIHGVKWSFINSLANSGITFLVSIVLARLLEPKEFGIIGMVTIFFAISSVFIESGFSSALIRKKDCTNLDYSTVFIFNVIVSFIAYFLLFLASSSIAQLLNENKLTNLIRVLGLILVIDSISVVNKAIIVKEMAFKKEAIISLIASLTSGTLSVYLAYLGYGIWSLILQKLIFAIIMTSLLWFSSRWRPIMHFSLTAFKEFYNFGSQLLATSLINVTQNNLYYLIIGRFFSATQLGYYTRAEQFNSIAQNQITGSIEKVTLSIFATLQEEGERLETFYFKNTKIVSLINLLSLTFLTVCAEPLIIILIGSKWAQSIPYLQVFCIGSLLYPFVTINQKIILIKGRTDLLLRLQILRTVLIALILIGGIFGGIMLMLWLRVLLTFIDASLHSLLVCNLIKVKIRHLLSQITPSIIKVTSIGAFMYLLTYLHINIFLLLGLQTFVGVGLFILIFELTNSQEYQEIKTVLLNAMKIKLN
jgi:O-antigen/teichoic acid export membrane protein